MKHSIFKILFYFFSVLSFCAIISTIVLPIILGLLIPNCNVGMVLAVSLASAGALAIPTLCFMWLCSSTAEVGTDEFSLNCDSFKSLKVILNENLLRNYYFNYRDNFVVVYGTTLSLYIKEVSFEEVFCFSVFKGERFDDKTFNEACAAQEKIIKQYLSTRKYNGRFLAPRLVHRMAVFCIDKDSELTESMKIMHVPYLGPYKKQQAYLYAVVSFSDEKIYITKPAPKIFNAGSTKTLYRKYRKEIFEALGIE